MARDDAVTLPVRSWPFHDAKQMARDFLVWRHCRVVRARVMQLLNIAIGFDRRPASTEYGVKMWSRWEDKTYAYCRYGTYGRYLADLLASIDQPFCFVDVGANQGLFSLIASRNPNCHKILALEPIAQTFEALTANLNLNQLGARAVPLNWGLSDTAGPIRMAMPMGHSGMATLGDHLDRARADCSLEMVELKGIEQLDQHFAPDLPIFAKIDVEGHERVAIEQLMMSRYRKNIIGLFYEFDARWSDKTAIAEILARSGFHELQTYGRGQHFDVFAVPVATF